MKGRGPKGLLKLDQRSLFTPFDIAGPLKPPPGPILLYGYVIPRPIAPGLISFPRSWPPSLALHGNRVLGPRPAVRQLRDVLTVADGCGLGQENRSASNIARR